MSGSEPFDDVTHELVTGLDEIRVPPAVLRASAPRRGFPLFAIAATALVVVVALALGAALRPANNNAAGPAAVASATPIRVPTASATPTPAPTVLAGRKYTEAEAKKLVEATALAVVDALKRKDGAKLATFAHPDKGVRFSMYPFVRTDTDVVLTAADLAIAFTDPKVRYWGVTDGKGDDLRVTFADYYPRFIYDVDFAKAPDVAYNRAIGTGNSTDNSATAYPDAVMVEFHYSGFDPQYAGMDWRSLRLFFEQKNGSWYLVGIVHGQWTI